MAKKARRATKSNRSKTARSAAARAPASLRAVSGTTRAADALLRSKVSVDTGLFLLSVGILFVLVWGRVLLGEQYLVGGDVLYDLLPWGANGSGRLASNGLLGDTVLQMLPWQEVVSDMFRHGHLPVWDQFSYSGTPLLANFQSAPFSIFTWIALPFTTPYGMGLAMLAKLWLAGVGMALFLRAMGARSLSAAVAGVVYAACSYMTVWLGWPNSSVAALAPWTFALAERYIVSGRAGALAGFALALAVEILAGHPETCAHMSLALTIYLLIRCAALGRRGIGLLLSLALSALLGASAAAVQIIPFFEWIQHIHAVASRTFLGAEQLPPQELTSWLIPNGPGNPGIDHSTLAGRPPNYNESTGFAGVGALVLAAIGVVIPGNAGRARAVGLTAIVLLGAGTVYGPLTPVIGHLPVFNASANWRMTSIVCFGISALAGLGLDTLLRRPIATGSRVTTFALFLGIVSLLGLAGAEVELLSMGAGVDGLLPRGPAQYIGFWLAVAVLSALAALAFTVAGLRPGRGRAAVAGFSALVVLEALLFAVPYNPHVAPTDVPPTSQALIWLQGHAGRRTVAATDSVLPPESATLYRLHDVSGYQAGLIDPRQILYWARADPGYNPALSRDVSLVRPGVRWLAAAGVAYLVTPGNQHARGTKGVYTGDGIAIAAVPGARPFSYAGAAIAPARDATQALRAMAADPLRVVAVEGTYCRTVQDSSARVVVRSRQAEEVRLEVTSHRATTVVVLQSMSPGWTAQVDGAPVPIQPADVLFQSVRVPRGHHTVVLRYGAPGLELGLLVTGLGLLGIILLALAPPVRRRWARSRRTARA